MGLFIVKIRLGRERTLTNNLPNLDSFALSFSQRH